MSDLISRKDAVELLKNDMENNGLPLDDEYNIGIDHAMCLLACVPTAEPKLGRNVKEEWNSLFECSVCGWECGDTVPCDTETFNYCPNCGAKMERSE